MLTGSLCASKVESGKKVWIELDRVSQVCLDRTKGLADSCFPASWSFLHFLSSFLKAFLKANDMEGDVAKATLNHETAYLHTKMRL